MSGFDIGIDEWGVVELHLILEADNLGRSLNAKNVGQEFYPENLTLAFLVALTSPSFYECLDLLADILLLIDLCV